MKIIGMISTLNDEDIIQEVIEYLISQGLKLVVLDNGSTDNTYAICEKFLNNGILTLETYKTKTNFPDALPLLLRILYDLALTHSPDWIIKSDADELLESGLQGVTLKEAISEIDANGYNLIQFDRFDFFMTDKDDESAQTIKEKLRYYSCYGDFLYRAWKFSPGIRIGDARGHYPIFPRNIPYKINQRKFVLRHYPIRNQKQAEKKIKERVKGITYTEKNKPDQKFQIFKAQKRHSNKIPSEILTKYNEDGNWNYKLQYCPLLTKDPPKRENLFSPNGELLARPKTEYELELEVHELNDRLKKMKTVGGLSRLAKNAIGKKIRKKIRKK